MNRIAEQYAPRHIGAVFLLPSSSTRSTGRATGRTGRCPTRRGSSRGRACRCTGRRGRIRPA